MDGLDKHIFLLADDSENDIALMRHAFIAAGVPNPLVAVPGGKEAIAYLKGEAPDDNTVAPTPLPLVLLLDLRMPGINGFEVLAWVRQQPTLKRLIVIILTASCREIDADRAYELGANFYLTKPSQFKELVEMVKCLHQWMRLQYFPTNQT